MARVRTRSENTANKDFLGQIFTFGTPGLKYYASTPYKEICNDELHKRKRSHGARLYVSGGPFDLKRYKYSRTNAYINRTVGANRYTGELINDSFGSNPSLGSYYTDSEDLIAIGTRGVARHKPGKPVANLGQFLVELRQIPTIPKFARNLSGLKGIRDTISDAKKLGSEYLNIEFGWKPFLKDLGDFIAGEENLRKALLQLRRDNGRVVRRHGNVKHSGTSTVTDQNGVCHLWPFLPNAFYRGGGVPSDFHGLTYHKESKRYWFSGAFRYWIPDIKKEPNPPLRTILKLLGTYPSPSLLWEVLPYSWLYDWFSTIGSILDNFSGNAAENLVLLYGYAMGEVKITDTAAHSALLSGGGTAIATVFREVTHKRRIEASPFGFSAALPDFTLRQAAILSALGLSRLKH